MIEHWKPVSVLGYEDLYQVSDRGRVRRIAAASGTRVGRIRRLRNNRYGYPYVTLYRRSCRKTREVHTLVAEAFLGPRPAGLEVNHKNGVKDDNRVRNLEYLTPRENMEHSYRVLGRKVDTMSRFGKPGLWFGPMKAEVEYVNARMKKLCSLCGHKPEQLRLKVTKGSGRHQTTTVFCRECGAVWVDEFKVLAHRAKVYLTGGIAKIGSIRKPA